MIRAIGLVASGLLATSAQAQELESWLARLRPGMWVKIELERTLENVLKASKVKAYTGELDEVTIESGVAAVDVSRLTVQTSIGLRVVASPSTKMEGPKQQRHLSPAFVAVGDRVKIAGQRQKDGSLLAEEIEIEGPTRPEGRLEGREVHELTAPIESIDAAGRRLVVFGLVVELHVGTRIRSSLPD